MQQLTANNMNSAFGYYNEELFFLWSSATNGGSPSQNKSDSLGMAKSPLILESYPEEMVSKSPSEKQPITDVWW